MRCFIAIELPEEINEALAELQGKLKRCGADIKWARPENIHLTLKFLGDTHEDDIEKISGKLLDICSNFDLFEIELAGIGVFPARKSPRVLWAGIKAGQTIIDLQKEIDSSMIEYGFIPEKRAFSPHLTIGRFRSSKFKEALLNEVRSQQERLLGSFEARSLILYRSELKPSGAEYTKISEALLKVS